MTSRTGNNRSGVMLIEMTLALILVTVALAMAGTLVVQSIKIDRRLAETERDRRGVEQMIQLLQRDIESSKTFVLNDQTVSLDNGIVWTIDREAKAMIRRAKDERTWEIGNSSIKITPARFGAMLEIASQSREPRRMPLVNRQTWAREALP
jgi:type II secretory pathway pseudopilin PulG